VQKQTIALKRIGLAAAVQNFKKQDKKRSVSSFLGKIDVIKGDS
jgi:hypothetical protein